MPICFGLSWLSCCQTRGFLDGPLTRGFAGWHQYAAAPFHPGEGAKGAHYQGTAWQASHYGSSVGAKPPAWPDNAPWVARGTHFLPRGTGQAGGPWKPFDEVQELTPWESDPASSPCGDPPWAQFSWLSYFFKSKTWLVVVSARAVGSCHGLTVSSHEVAVSMGRSPVFLL